MLHIKMILGRSDEYVGYVKKTRIVTYEVGLYMYYLYWSNNI